MNKRNVRAQLITIETVENSGNITTNVITGDIEIRCFLIQKHSEFFD